MKQPFEYSFNGRRYRIPAGTFAGVFPYVINRDPSRFSQPESYDPLRYRRGESLPMLFGTGVFGCIAERFSRMLIPTVIDELLLGYDVRLEGPCGPRKCRVHLLYPSQPAWARVVARTGNSH